jgi:hypothetical protein
MRMATYFPGIDQLGMKFHVACTGSVQLKSKVCIDLLADAELTDNVAIANRVVGLQIIQKATTLAHQHQ